MYTILQIILLTLTINIGNCTSDKYLGQYFIDENKIVMCEGKNFKKKDIVHELFHGMWHNILSKQDRDRWRILFEHSNTRDFARPYGKTNEREDFATIGESLYLHRNKRGKTRIMRYKIKYFKYLIKKYATIKR